MCEKMSITLHPKLEAPIKILKKMKRININMMVMIACMTLGFSWTAKGQIYYSEACFYTSSGSSEIKWIVRFEGAKGRAWLKSDGTTSNIRKKLAQSEDYYEDQVWTDVQNAWLYEYDASKSTSSREVYRRKKTHSEYPTYGGVPMYGMTPTTVFDGYDYVAFSKDKSSFIKWFEKKDNYDGSTGSKQYFSRVPKEELLPKSVNYDFLND